MKPPRPPLRAAATLVLLLVTAAAPAQVDPRGRAILFVRGADGSGGATEGGTFAQRTEQLSDVWNGSTAPGNHGWGTLRQQLEGDGFSVAQLIESPAPLTTAALLPYRIVVMGSNNRSYSAAEVAAFHAYVDQGGSALFISDANWGPTWEAAPSSDNAFLARYGAQVWQDNTESPPVSRLIPWQYLDPDHPLLSGTDGEGGVSDVDIYLGEGVSLFRIVPGSDGYQAVRLVDAFGMNYRTNPPGGGPGVLQPAGMDDTPLFFLESGDSRIVGHYDRNTFFNDNGAGANITLFDDAQLALNVFRFLAAVDATASQEGGGCGTSGAPLLVTGVPVLGLPLSLAVSGAAPQAPAILLASGVGPGPSVLPGGCVSGIDAQTAIALSLGSTDVSGGAAASLALPEAHLLAGFRVAAQVVILVPGGPLGGQAELSTTAHLRLGWVP